jgi:hypothetical protein
LLSADRWRQGHRTIHCSQTKLHSCQVKNDSKYVCGFNWQITQSRGRGVEAIRAIGTHVRYEHRELTCIAHATTESHVEDLNRMSKMIQIRNVPDAVWLQPGTLMRTLFGIGTPRTLHGRRLALVFAASTRVADLWCDARTSLANHPSPLIGNFGVNNWSQTAFLGQADYFICFAGGGCNFHFTIVTNFIGSYRLMWDQTGLGAGSARSEFDFYDASLNY